MSIAAQNIQAMIAAVKSEREALESRLAILRDRENTLRAWLTEESPTQAELPVVGDVVGTPLSNFLRSVLSDGKSHTTQRLAQIAATKPGLIKENSSPGRVVHFALLGLSQHGLVERTAEGMWRLRK